MASREERKRAERRGAAWAVLDLLWERVLRFFGFAPLPYGWFERATRRDLPLAFGILRFVRRRLPWLFAPLVLLIVAGAVAVRVLPPTQSMLRNDLDHVPMPEGVLGVTSREGNLVCLGGCPAVTRVVVVPGGVADWGSEWDRLLVDRGVRMGPWGEDGSGGVTAKAAAFHRRTFTSVVPGPVELDGRDGRRRVDVPEGHVALVLRIEGTRESTPSI